MGSKVYQADLFGKEAVEPIKPSKEGNVVLGYTSSNFLMLDVDDQPEWLVTRFAKQYAKFHNLGSVLVLRTSESCKTDLFGNRLGNYCIIFGKPLDWKEIQWHINETKRLGIINRSFAKLREFGSITIRVNAKNNEIPPPEIIKFYYNGDMNGIVRFISHRNLVRDLGRIGQK